MVEKEESNDVEYGGVIVETRKFYSAVADDKLARSKKVLNRLYNIKVQFEIKGIKPFTVNAILDTGCTTCCLDMKVVPKEALKKNPYHIVLSGLNSTQIADLKLK